MKKGPGGEWMNGWMDGWVNGWIITEYELEEKIKK
jgi:hypothetical protein